MLFTVSDKIKSKTAKCTHDFSCLSTGVCDNPAKCKVMSDFDKNMLIVEPQDSNNVSCPYHVTFSMGSGHMCTCPTHYALYLKIKRQESYKR